MVNRVALLKLRSESRSDALPVTTVDFVGVQMGVTHCLHVVF